MESLRRAGACVFMIQFIYKSFKYQIKVNCQRHLSIFRRTKYLKSKMEISNNDADLLLTLVNCLGTPERSLVY